MESLDSGGGALNLADLSYSLHSLKGGEYNRGTLQGILRVIPGAYWVCGNRNHSVGLGQVSD